eukprot:gene2898-3163_t
MSKDLKPQLYYYIRRGWNDHVIQLCESSMAKKGKDPVTVFWHAFSLGRMGLIAEALSKLETLQSRKDLQLPMVVAMIYFHQRASSVDRETVRALKQDLSIAETVTKEAGLILAARFHLFVGDFSQARVLTQRILTDTSRYNNNNSASSGGGGGAVNVSSVFEVEARLIEQWCVVEESLVEEALSGGGGGGGASNSDSRRALCEIDTAYSTNNRVDLQDLDGLLCWAKARWAKGMINEAINVLNQAIATNSSFLPALTDKALLLASTGDWEQALDSAQRVLDSDTKQIDALTVIALHAFSQEAQPHDAVQKWEDLDHAIREREPHNPSLALDLAHLVSIVACRQPRALQIALRLLDFSLKSPLCQLQGKEESRILTEMGEIALKQGPGAGYNTAERYFKEASKRDSGNLAALCGLIHYQLLCGAIEDAESQLELLSLMHNTPEEMGYPMLYLQALVSRAKKDPAQEQFALLQQCLDHFIGQQTLSRYYRGTTVSSGAGGGGGVVTGGLLEAQGGQKRVYLDAFDNLRKGDPDFALTLALEVLTHVDSAANPAQYLSSGSAGDGGGGGGGVSGGMGQVLQQARSAQEQQEEGNDDHGIEAVGTSAWYRTTLLGDDDASGGGGGGGGGAVGGVDGSVEEAVSTSPALFHGMKLLQSVMTLSPGLLPAYLELSRAYSNVNLPAQAINILGRALSYQPQSPGVLLQMALLEAQRGATATADRLLQQALSADFNIRSQGKFRLVRAILRGQQGEAAEGLADLQALLQAAFPDTTAMASGAGGGGGSSGNAVFNFNVQSSTSTSSSATTSGNSNDEVVLGSGWSGMSFGGGGGSGSGAGGGGGGVFINYADMLRLTEEDVITACVVAAGMLAMLHRNTEAHRVLAHAKVLTAGTPQEVLLSLASAQLFVARGDIDQALRTLEKVPPTSGIYPRACVMKANLLLTNTHNRQAYSDCYLSLVEVAPTAYNYTLLADSYLRILNIDAAIDALEQALALDGGKNGRLRGKIGRALVASHDYHRAVDFYETALRDLTNPHDLARLYVKLQRTEAAIPKEHFLMGEEEEEAEALRYLDEASQYDNTSSEVLLLLAKIYRKKKSYEACQVQCNKILSSAEAGAGGGGATVVEALLLLSEVLLLMSDADKAVEPLLRYLQPALGTIEKKDKRHLSQAGYHYCHGLYLRYTNDIAKAILSFNFCRRDPVWAAKALLHMIQLYLNPDQAGIWEEATSATSASTTLSSEGGGGGGTQEDTDYLPAVLGLATCFMMDKQQHKARNLLKRVGKLEARPVAEGNGIGGIGGSSSGKTGGNSSGNNSSGNGGNSRIPPGEDDGSGDDFERANLLLAKFYIDKGRSDQAQEVCKKLLQENKSCSQAWELLGLIFEKDATYDLAADAYAKAWALEFEASATVGFKLAFAYLKCRRLVEAVDVCQTVLKQYPDYPRIQEEILNKALQAMRTNAVIL